MVARGTFPRGWALAVQGQRAEGIAHMREGMDAEGMMGRVQRPYRGAMLAEVYGQIGQTAEALRLLAEARVLTHQYGGHFYAAEVHRLTGELLLCAYGRGCVGEPISRIVDERRTCGPGDRPIAPTNRGGNLVSPGPRRRSWQQAKSLELRAAMSLSRLWQQQASA